MSDAYFSQCPRFTPVTSYEHAMLSIRGDPQILLSTYLRRPVTKTIVRAINCPGNMDKASPSEPWTQSRQAILKCGTRVICKATSFVTISSPSFARYWTSIPAETITIPQLFARYGTLPTFTLLGINGMGDQLKRVYRLEGAGVECEVVEVFPDRDLFLHGPSWDVAGLAPQDTTPIPRFIPPPLSRNSSSTSLNSEGHSIYGYQPDFSPVTPLERALLANRGDPQLLLSKLIQRETTKFIKKARSCPRSPDSANGAEPWTQSRQVQLMSGSRVLCNATSFVTISSPLWARMWASVPSDKITLPGLFALLGVVPEFTLLGISARGGEMRRTYRVAADGVECEVLEVFPDRDMFGYGPNWDVEGLGPVIEDGMTNACLTKAALEAVDPSSRPPVSPRVLPSALAKAY